jgi:hypothetical protein
MSASAVKRTWLSHRNCNALKEASHVGKETSSCEKAFTDKHNVLTSLCGGKAKTNPRYANGLYE